MGNGATRTEVRSPTRTEVRSPTRTSTKANTRGNFTSTVTGGAGAGATSVTINIPRQTPSDTGALMNPSITVNPNGNDTGNLTDTLATYVGFTPAKVIFFGAGGLLIGHLAGKHALIGALVGAGAGFYLAQKAIAAGAGNPNLPGSTA